MLEQEKQQRYNPDTSLFVSIDSVNKLSKTRLKICNPTPTKGGASAKTSTLLLSEFNSKISFLNNNKIYDEEFKNNCTNDFKKNKKTSKSMKNTSNSESIKNEIDSIETLNSLATKKSNRSRLSEVQQEAPTNPIGLLSTKYPSLKGHISQIDKLFKGLSVTLTQCLTCENLKKCQEVFYDRTLPVNTNNNGKTLINKM